MHDTKWENMTNEELCNEYNQTQSNELFEYFLDRNSGLIEKFMHKYFVSFPEYEDDIRNLAISCMWEAIKRYDNSLNYKFSTFYYYWSKKAITLFFRYNKNIIRIPAHKLSDINTLDMCDVYSLNKVIKSGLEEPDLEVIDLYSDDSVPQSDETLLDSDRHDQLEKALKRLDNRSYQCIKWYMGLMDGHTHSLEEIGKKYGVTRERIRQIVSKGLKKLKKIMSEYYTEEE